MGYWKCRKQIAIFGAGKSKKGAGELFAGRCGQRMQQVSLESNLKWKFCNSA